MHRATTLLLTVCLILASCLGAVIVHIVRIAHASTPPAITTTSIPLGLDTGNNSDTQSDSTFPASSALLLDTNTKNILFQQHAFERRPLASITKLMTAMVALDHGIPWNKEADILPNEYTVGGELMLSRGETVTMRDLFNASLLGSANNATMAYVRQLGIPKEEFIQEMNRKAIELHLEQTEFHDVTGLTPQNVSTAYEIAIMANYAFTHYPEISQATSQREYSFTVKGTNREHTIHSTNKPVQLGDLTVTGSKTGFLYEAGYCLVVQGADALKNRIAVVMNAPSEQDQFVEVDRLLKMQAK